MKADEGEESLVVRLIGIRLHALSCEYVQLILKSGYIIPLTCQKTICLKISLGDSLSFTGRSWHWYFSRHIEITQAGSLTMSFRMTSRLSAISADPRQSVSSHKEEGLIPWLIPFQEPGLWEAVVWWAWDSHTGNSLSLGRSAVGIGLGTSPDSASGLWDWGRACSQSSCFCSRCLTSQLLPSVFRLVSIPQAQAIECSWVEPFCSFWAVRYLYSSIDRFWVSNNNEWAGFWSTYCLRVQITSFD